MISRTSANSGNPNEKEDHVSPVAQVELTEDLFDLDIEFVLESAGSQAIYACSEGGYTCTTGVSMSGTCAATQNCGGTCAATYGNMAPGMCYSIDEHRRAATLAAAQETAARAARRGGTPLGRSPASRLFRFTRAAGRREGTGNDFQAAIKNRTRGEKNCPRARITGHWRNEPSSFVEFRENGRSPGYRDLPEIRGRQEIPTKRRTT